jgi:tetratricopeptide (TPR) repeat protein
MDDREGLLAGQIYNNMAAAYLDLGEFEKSLEFYNKSEEIRYMRERDKLSRTIINKAQVYIKLKSYMEAEEALIKGIENAMEYNDKEYILLGYQHLIILYKELKDNEKVEETYKRIIELLKEKETGDFKKIYLEMSKFYIEQGKLDKADKYMELSQQ